MKTGLISIFTNETELSTDVEMILKQKLKSRGYKVTDGYDEDAELLISSAGSRNRPGLLAPLESAVYELKR